MEMRDRGGEWKVKLGRMLQSPIRKGPIGSTILVTVTTLFFFFNLIFSFALFIANLDPLDLGSTSSLGLKKYLFLGQLFV